jgi:hypothetical protein
LVDIPSTKESPVDILSGAASPIKSNIAALPALEESTTPLAITCLRNILDLLPIARETLPR